MGSGLCSPSPAHIDSHTVYYHAHTTSNPRFPSFLPRFQGTIPASISGLTKLSRVYLINTKLATGLAGNPPCPPGSANIDIGTASKALQAASNSGSLCYGCPTNSFQDKSTTNEKCSPYTCPSGSHLNPTTDWNASRAPACVTCVAGKWRKEERLCEYNATNTPPTSCNENDCPVGTFLRDSSGGNAAAGCLACTGGCARLGVFRNPSIWVSVRVRRIRWVPCLYTRD